MESGFLHIAEKSSRGKRVFLVALIAAMAVLILAAFYRRGLLAEYYLSRLRTNQELLVPMILEPDQSPEALAIEKYIATELGRTTLLDGCLGLISQMSERGQEVEKRLKPQLDLAKEAFLDLDSNVIVTNMIFERRSPMLGGLMSYTYGCMWSLDSSEDVELALPLQKAWSLLGKQEDIVIPSHTFPEMRFQVHSGDRAKEILKNGNWRSSHLFSDSTTVLFATRIGPAPTSDSQEK